MKRPTHKIIAAWLQEGVWTTDTAEAQRIDAHPLSGSERHQIMQVPADWTETQIDNHIKSGAA